jgi:hypothetical protein
VTTAKAASAAKCYGKPEKTAKIEIFSSTHARSG